MIVKDRRDRLASDIADAVIELVELAGRVYPYPPANAVAPAIWIDSDEGDAEGKNWTDTTTVVLVTNAAPHAAGPWLDETTDRIITYCTASGSLTRPNGRHQREIVTTDNQTPPNETRWPARVITFRTGTTYC